MKYMAIIDADEKPVSCEFFGCNGNVRPYLLGATTDIKTLEQEPKTGHWVKKSQYGNDYCSECDYELLMYGQPKYCPNCGARMSESKFFAKVAESYYKGLRDGLTAESEE